MPILASEPMMFPDDLLSDSTVVAVDSVWWVLHTQARHEKVLMRRLRSLNIRHYCPLIQRRNRSPAGRVRTSQLPLFSGYVFMLGSLQDRYRALTTNCIVNCLPVPDAERFVFDLHQFRRLIETGAPLSAEARIQPGRRVRVKAGSMAGLEGIVVKRRGKEWLVVELEFLQRGASVLLEDYLVEAI